MEAFLEAKALIRPVAVNHAATLHRTQARVREMEGTVTQYLLVMGLWRTLRPRLRNSFLEVHYEELVDDLGGVSRRALGFLGRSRGMTGMRFYEHARSKPLRSPSYAEVTKPVTKRTVGHWQHYRRHIEPYVARLEPMLKTLGYA